MRLEHDKEADAIYIYLTDAPYAYGEDLDTERRIDYDASGKPRGIELLCESHGVNADNHPYSEQISRCWKSGKYGCLRDLEAAPYPSSTKIIHWLRPALDKTL